MPEEVKERLSRCHHLRKYSASHMAVVVVENAIGRKMSHQDRTLADQMFDLVQQCHLEVSTEVGTDCTIAYKWNSSDRDPFQMQVHYVLVGGPFDGIVISRDHQDRLASGIQRIHRFVACAAFEDVTSNDASVIVLEPFGKAFYYV